ncbi:MAG: DUF262 domain-containing protein [Bacteroidetes bacterium]|nr:DUF262 domain-containing protein [Bacteroidota bacterium]
MRKQDSTAELQKGISFLELISKQKIQIPIIQRDYAQGRLDEKATAIRDEFLTDLIDALTIDMSKPLVLDFIYGSTQDDDSFTPLDGQQRLTTLFLLHWYLISEEELPILGTRIDNTIFSKFTYETRISSKDFCNSLIRYSLVSVKDAIHPPLSKSIMNQHWFMWSWRKDPTIKAMLVMLDEIDLRIGKLTDEIRKSMWDNLKIGRIVFHLLPPEKFSLTDELYVKMNARGKELSRFDILKSTLEEQMRLNNVSEDVQNKWCCNIDSNWIDLFWNNLAKPKLTNGVLEEEQRKCVDSVEVSYLRFLKRMMVFHLFVNENCFNCDWTDSNLRRYVPFEYEEINILDKIRDYSVRNDILSLMSLFCKTNFFNQSFFEFVIRSFETIIYQINEEKHDGSELIEGVFFEFNPKTIFEAFIDDNINYDTRVQFYALLQFFKYNSADKVFQSDVLKCELNSWMRIIRNLSTNTNTYFYNGFDDFNKSLKAIDAWSNVVFADHTKNTIIDYLIINKPKLGFNSDQLMEETVKAHLLRESTNNINWEKAIRLAEEHKYFLGQIRFLLEWSKEEDSGNEKYNLELFNEYYSKICQVFGFNGLLDELCNSDSHLFRNVLMANCDYYLLNDSFVNNTAKDRDWSWKRYLRETGQSHNIKELLDKWNQIQSFKIFCESEVRGSKVSDWRKYFRDKPEIYNELFNNKISWWNWENGEICLLSKIRWSSRHKELRTFFWHLKYKSTDDKYLDSTDGTNPFSAVFIKGENKEIFVKFIPTKNEIENKWSGQYVVITNYDTNLPKMVKKLTTNTWEQYFSAENHEETEAVLKVLINNKD